MENEIDKTFTIKMRNNMAEENFKLLTTFDNEEYFRKKKTLVYNYKYMHHYSSKSMAVVEDHLNILDLSIE